MSPTRLRVKTAEPAPTNAIFGISSFPRVMGYVKVCPVAARWIADDREQHRVEDQHEVQEQQERDELHRDDAAVQQVHDEHDRRQVEDERALEAQRGTAVGPGERIAADAPRSRRSRREVGEDGEHHLAANLSWLLTCAFMSLKTFAASSLPLRNSSSVGCTIRLICGALSVIG